MNEEEIFRKKSLDRMKSPENLDDYIQVSNPAVWLLLIGIIVLLAGACVWGIFGHIDSYAEANIHAEKGMLVCRIADETISSVQEGMTVRFNDYEAVIREIEQENGVYVCTLQTEQRVPDGFYEGRLILESCRPLSFILN